MEKTRYGLIALCLLLCSATVAPAQVSIGISTPNVSIGINFPIYPELVPVPGYPVYYAPQVAANYFFYDGMYWVFWDDNWYASYWYNGPWSYVEPVLVPVFILRIPVRYYVRPPVYFHGWRHDAPPRWGHHWGPKWEQRRHGWDRWNRAYVPPRAPLPVYQRQYSGDRYPRFEQQRSLQKQHYRYEPRNQKVRGIYRKQVERGAPGYDQRRRVQEPATRVPQQRDVRPPQQRDVRPPQQRDVRPPQQRDVRPSQQPRQPAPAAPQPQSQPRGRDDYYRSAPPHATPQQRGPSYREQGRQPGGEKYEQRAPKQQDMGRPQGYDKGRGGEKKGGDGGGKGRDK